MTNSTCCFIGHRTIKETDELKQQLNERIEYLIVNDLVDTFIFGSKSRFNDLCYEIVSKLRQRYPHIKRIYVRAEFPEIDDDYRDYLLTLFEDTYYPNSLVGAGKASYVKRNREMITNSRFIILYYDETAVYSNRKSGTKLAYDFALKCGKIIFRYPQ